MKKPWTDRFGDFMAGKGFYIVLFLCVAAIGISGYYLFSSLAGSGQDISVAAPAQVTVSPKATPVPAPSLSPTAPSLSPSPSLTPPAVPSPSPVSSPSPTPSPKPSPSPKPVVANVFTWPVKGAVVDAYSPDQQRYDVTMEDWRTHAGIDIAAEPGVPVKAAASGTVESVTVSDLLGTTLTIEHASGVKSMYANLAELPTVKAGDSVTTGDIIGSVGDSAKAESAQAVHLHFEMYQDGKYADPLHFLPELK